MDHYRRNCRDIRLYGFVLQHDRHLFGNLGSRRRGPVSWAGRPDKQPHHADQRRECQPIDGHYDTDYLWHSKRLYVQMQAWVYILPMGPGVAFPSNASGSAYAMNTGVLRNVVVRNQDGVVIPYQLVTASGSANFASLGQSAETPEPATIGLALGLMAWARGRRRM